MIAKSIKDKFGTDFTQDNILITVGATGGLNIIFKTLLNPADEIITFAPFFAEYRNYVNYIISDEPYRELAYDNAEVPYLSKYYKNTINRVVSGTAFGCPGYARTFVLCFFVLWLLIIKTQFPRTYFIFTKYLDNKYVFALFFGTFIT